MSTCARPAKAVARPEAKPRFFFGHHLFKTPTPFDQTIDWQKPFSPHKTAIAGTECWNDMAKFSTTEPAMPNII